MMTSCNSGWIKLRVGLSASGVSIRGCRLQGGERLEIADELRSQFQSGLNLTR
jgi:hypothetical protein